MKISKIRIKGYLGIDEFDYTPGNVNVFKGPNGSGKTSIIEALEATFNSKPKRRTEVINHSKDEATLFIETDTGIEIDRKLRKNKADYLKVSSDDVNIKSTEGQLKSFFSGSIFRPLDFINLGAKKQTDEILSTINIPFSQEQFTEWFGSAGVLTGINTDKHMLMILKNIEVNHFNTRQDVNREITTLEHQAKGIEKELPDNYNGDDWENVVLGDLFNAVSEAEKINQYISNGNEAKINYEAKISAINSTYENGCKSIELKYKELETDCNDIIKLSKDKINAATELVFNSQGVIDSKNRSLDLELQEKINLLKQEYSDKKEAFKNEIINSIDEQKDIISMQEQKISNKNVEKDGLLEKKELELKSMKESKEAAIKNQEELMCKWDVYLKENEPVDVEPLKAAVEEAEFMRSHLREWDRIKEIRNVKIAEKSRYSSELTNIIETARSLPATLLKQYKLPVEGITIDSDGLIRINGTLLDGLSDGEKLDTALRIAHYKMGELRIMCLDRFEALDPMNQKKVVKFCEDNDIQAFITMPSEGEGVDISNHI